jgi:hypothetical protein
LVGWPGSDFLWQVFFIMPCRKCGSSVPVYLVSECRF